MTKRQLSARAASLLGGLLVLGLDFGSVPASGTEPFDLDVVEGPVIDMHLHAFGWNEYGDPPPPNEVTGRIPEARTDEEALAATLSAMDRHGVVLGVASGPLDRVRQWRAGAPERLLGGAYVSSRVDLPDLAALRQALESGEVSVLGELGLQYRGVGAPTSLLVTGVSIIQPEEGTVTAPRDILISGGKIIEIGEPGSIPSDRAARVLAAEGLYALPGLIDVHTHMGDGGIGEQTQADREGVMRQFLRYGVTSILNLGGGGGTEEELAEWKRRCKARELDCPDILGTGVLVTAPGSHPIGTIWNLPPDTDPEVIYRRGAVAIAEDEDVTAVLDRKTAMGVDAVKVIIEDWDPNDPLPRLSKAKVAELAQAGHARGLRVFAHVSAAEHVEDALAGGIDGVMHSAEDPISDATLASMAKAGMFYVATLALYDGFFDRASRTVGNDHEPYALAGGSSRAINSLREFEHSPFTAERAESSKAVIHDNLRRASARGVPLALGTDVNNPSVFPGYSAHEELELMVEAGLTPARALVAATVGGASLLGKASSLGRIEEGYQADLIILGRNPLEDILNTRTLRSVIHDGRVLEDVVATQVED